MRPYTNEEVDRIAEACRAFLAATDRRNSGARRATLNEEAALGVLRYELATREREALSAAMGTAA